MGWGAGAYTKQAQDRAAVVHEPAGAVQGVAVLGVGVDPQRVINR